MSIKSSLIKNSAYNLAGYAYLLIASFFSVSIVLNNLGAELFGVLIFLGSLIPIFAVFDFGISNAVIRQLSLRDNQPDMKLKYWQTSLYIFLILGIVQASAVSIILYLMGQKLPILYPYSDQIDLLIPIIAITVFINNLNSHFLTLPQANQRFDIYNLKSILVGTGNTLITALITFKTNELGTIFAGQLLFHLLTSIVIIHYVYRNFSWEGFKPHKYSNHLRQLFSFGLRNFLGIFASQVEAQFSKYALGIMVSARELTTFNIPQNIIAKGAGVVSQIAQAFFPLGTSLLTRDRFKKMGKTIIIVQVMVFIGGLISIVLTRVYGEMFLLWWLKNPEIVTQAYPILKILSYYFLLTALTPIPSVFFQATNKPQIPSYFAVFTTLTEALLIIFLTPKYQALGTAYAVLLASIITVPPFLIASYIEYKNQHRIYFPII